MIKNRILIDTIPAILWGEPSNKILVAVHGNLSNKEDVPISILAEVACKKGYQVLSFDLPEHGERKEETIPCKVVECQKDLTTIMQYVHDKEVEVSLFANSIGAYFSLLAYAKEEIKKAWFLSPVVDMQRMIEQMMEWFHITADQLQREKEIQTEMKQTLYWDYYCYVKEHPIESWPINTHILYGEKDTLVEHSTIESFVKRHGGKLTVLKDAEHYFHTPQQLASYTAWLEETMEDN